MSIPHFLRPVNTNPHAAINRDLRLIGTPNPPATLPRMIRPEAWKSGERRTAPEEGDVLRLCALALVVVGVETFAGALLGANVIFSRKAPRLNPN